MIKLPQLNKANWKKNLRELELSEFPSLPEKLKSLRARLKKKEKLTNLDEIVGFATFKKYFEDFNSEVNASFVRNIDYSQFKSKPPLDHQKDAVEFLLKNDRCILADTMGKGKTLSSVYAAMCLDPRIKVLIVTTNSLKYNFAKEIFKFTPQVAIIDKKWEQDRFTIVHYDALKKYTNEIYDLNPQIIICDEVHEVKNLKTGKAKALSEILKANYPKKLWFLTGTPVANRPLEFFSLLKLLKHPLSKNWQSYVERYCNGFIDRWGRWQTKGSSNLVELHNLTQGIILRRTNKKGDLPEFKRYPEYFEMSEDVREKYDNAVDVYVEGKNAELQEQLAELGFKGDVTGNYEAREMTKLIVNRQFCALQKLEDGNLKKLIQRKLDEDPTNKIIVFTNFISVVDSIHNEYKDISVKLDGRVKDIQVRQNIIDEFNENPELKILVCNLRIGSTGYNVQSANIVIVNDMDWVPNTMLQAECRIWRFGQTRNVEFIYPMYRNSVEEALYSVVNGKMQIVSELIDGTREEYFEGENSLDLNDITKDDILKEIFAQLN